MLTLEQIVRAEQDALAIETRIAQCPPYTAINDLNEVCRTPSNLRFTHPAVIRPLTESRHGAFIVECPSLNSTVLWVATSNNDYRADYLAYLEAAYGLKLESLPKSYDVDHLYNRSRAQAYSLKFLRMALVPFRINRGHGASYERDLTINEANRTITDRKLMDAISCMKYFGFLSPLRSNPRKSEIAAYASFASSRLGLNAAAEIESIEYLRQKASTPWARKT